ncbi:hypothetical protein LMJF_25_0030 [Leishmania major strain Friedlin]|uniref:C2H2-type domain-containing protein n=1 Tax=Leishmania major TaxID=5664 RepID=Q4QA93_LEIMA|nr:hypothetical protein LMJF_25_0030 [Leishmania major strain Friedlin]CAG9575009.1 Domain_of_unknown_function_(DUF2431)_-_putative [Leishmania major strain Friedlin]CAJ04367.1 hypothetical protein LMJF_25_0030 [Leishmania major strain Friedlin]|eukprot:XP_001683755.1 hypothetical protein LMJF_25_0030 [Leishmania major strain Friedlin]
MPQASRDEGTRTIGPAAHVLPDRLFILLVGEGNLSFAYALVKRLSRSAVVRRATQNEGVAGERRRGIIVEVIATTFDSEAEVSRKYPEAVGFLAYFAAKRRVRVGYYGDVNATSLSSAAAPLRDHPFHLLIFNNPHIGFEDLYRQIALLSHFFRSARELHTRAPTEDFPQEIVVTLCNDQAQRWDLLGCAARSGYICVAAVPMRSADFPEYTNRRHQRHAAFPFRIMVQYYFVAPQAALHGVLRDLSAEMTLWEQERQSRLHEGLPCSYTCVEWLRVAKSYFAYSSQVADATTEVSGSAATNPCVLSGDDFSVNGSACSAQQPLPLLHPTLVARVVGAAAMAPFFSDPSEDHTEAFMPYLPSSTWIRLYRAQRVAERRCSCSVALAPSTAPPLPPHLDSSILGRLLTSKEASKLQRYLTGYGAAMRAKAQQRRQAETQAACAWSCRECHPARTFETEDDLRQHQIAKHCGATPLAPTLYARVHEQVETASRRLEEALAGLDIEDGGDNNYCEVCGLRFKSGDAYEEHLRYLSPLPGDDAADLVCHVCQPAKCFTDRRALEQHRATKHAPAFSATREETTPANI